MRVHCVTAISGNACLAVVCTAVFTADQRADSQNSRSQYNILATNDTGTQVSQITFLGLCQHTTFYIL